MAPKGSSAAPTPATSPPPAAAAEQQLDAQGPAVGIDLGSEYCCVAYYKDNNGEVIPNEDGERSTPSVVAFDGSDRVRLRCH